MQLIPHINGTVREMGGFVSLPRTLTWEGPCAPEALEVFCNRLHRLPGLGKVAITPAEDGFLVFQRVKLPEEAYRLLITEEGVTVEAAGQPGFTWALTTLVQLAAAEGPDLPCCLLEDAPRYPWRGIMLDVCRHFSEVSDVKKIIEQCALYKLNRFHWHLSDDQGYRIESRVFPALNTVSAHRRETNGDGQPHGGLYTQEEIREVVAYAAARGVEVVPEIDLPGHTTAILAAYPALSCTGEPLEVSTHFGILERILCAGKEEVYDFLEKLLGEVCSLFPSRYFHIGGDEAPKSEWQKCPDCNRAMEKLGLTDYEALQAHFTGRLVKLLEKKGKTVIGWNEALASGQLDGSVIAQYWNEMDPRRSYTLEEARKGRALILSNMETFYLDYPHALAPLRAQLHYAPNLRGVSVPEEARVLGIEAPLWTEWLPAAALREKQLFPRLFAVAENAWHGPVEEADFASCLPAALRQLGKAGVAFTPPEEADIGGPEGIRRIVEHFAGMLARMGGNVPADMVPKRDPETMRAMGRMIIGGFMTGRYSEAEIEETLDQLFARLMGA